MKKPSLQGCKSKFQIKNQTVQFRQKTYYITITSIVIHNRHKSLPTITMFLSITNILQFTNQQYTKLYHRFQPIKSKVFDLIKTKKKSPLELEKLTSIR